MRYYIRNPMTNPTHYIVGSKCNPIPGVIIPSVSTGIHSINGIIATICKHVITQQALACGDIDIRIEETANCGIIISALEVIQPGICFVALARMAFSHSGRHSQGVAPNCIQKNLCES